MRFIYFFRVNFHVAKLFFDILDFYSCFFIRANFQVAKYFFTILFLIRQIILAYEFHFYYFV